MVSSEFAIRRAVVPSSHVPFLTRFQLPFADDAVVMIASEAHRECDLHRPHLSDVICPDAFQTEANGANSSRSRPRAAWGIADDRVDTVD
jgi:hypothetical protein